MISIALMRDEQRRSKFRAWFAGPPLHGDRRLLMARAKISKGRVTQLLDDREPFGERAAAELARKIGLPKGFFDSAELTVGAGPHESHGGPGVAQAAAQRLTPDEDELLRVYRTLTERDQGRALERLYALQRAESTAAPPTKAESLGGEGADRTKLAPGGKRAA